MCSMHLSTPAPKNETRHGTAAPGNTGGVEWGVGVVANSMGCRVKVSTSFPPHFSRLVRVPPMMERYLNASLPG